MKRSSRRNDDQYNPSLTSDQYDQNAKRFTPPLPAESSMVVSGKHTYATQAKVVLKKLVGRRDDNTISRPGAERGDRLAPVGAERTLPPRNIIIK